MTIKEFREKYGVHITEKHNGKMNGFASLSTSVLRNRVCIERAKNPDSICNKCYAARMANMYHSLENVLAKNTEVLTSQVIPVKGWPTLNYSMFRLEAFGDLNNTIQVVNYFNFARKNPRTTFALWTKNAYLIDAVISEGTRKPRNLIIIASSPRINEERTPRYEFIDKVFTVYDKQTAKTVDINCGARNCLTCGRCYRKTRNVEYIREILK